ncbi:MAG TPA: NlpC/P60 family protein [Caulobacteraceae bacterium]|jgi:cell wall-associated NlpC family hydrolase
MSDARLTLARTDLADARLEGVAAAARYQPTERFSALAAHAAVRARPDASAERVDELLHGEDFEVLAREGDFAFGQARRDGYVGWVEALALGPPRTPTHRVSALRAYAFAEPSIKTAAVGPYSLNALVEIVGADGAFLRAADGTFFSGKHLAPIGVFERDPAAVAERFLGAPYLWGGRTSLGLDCSGLVQQALYACGRACPRDTDLQALLGQTVDVDGLQRGDLVCWKGHIGMMLDAQRLLHANATDMCVAIEPVADAIARIGPPTALRRL